MNNLTTCAPRVSQRQKFHPNWNTDWIVESWYFHKLDPVLIRNFSFLQDIRKVIDPENLDYPISQKSSLSRQFWKKETLMVCTFWIFALEKLQLQMQEGYIEFTDMPVRRKIVHHDGRDFALLIPIWFSNILKIWKSKKNKRGVVRKTVFLQSGWP